METIDVGLNISSDFQGKERTNRLIHGSEKYCGPNERRQPVKKQLYLQESINLMTLSDEISNFLGCVETHPVKTMAILLRPVLVTWDKLAKKSVTSLVLCEPPADASHPSSRKAARRLQQVVVVAQWRLKLLQEQALLQMSFLQQ